jgi:hypothetical protein
MAINTQKLLPRSSIVKIDSKKTIIKKKSNKNDSEYLLKDNLVSILKKLIDIDKILKKDLLLYKKTVEIKRKNKEQDRFITKENRLEKSPEEELSNSIDDAKVPQLGIFDGINRFITFTFLGWITGKLFKYLPELLDFTKKIGFVVNFIEDFSKNVFRGFVDFIDWGYNSYDQVRDFVGGLENEPLLKAFDDFSSNLNKFVNLAIIAGIAASGGTDFGLGKKSGKLGSGLGGGSSQKLTIQERVKNSRIRGIQRKYGPSARKIYENALNNGKTPQQAEAAVKKGIKKGVSIRPGADSLSAKTAKKGSVLSRGVGKSVNRLSTKVLGKAGKKLVGKAFGKIPIIGGLVSFIISVVSGEDPGRAAAKAVGFTIGSGLGTFIPIPFAGTILGGLLGDIVGGALYDTLINRKKEKPSITANKNGGKVTTRGGKIVGAPIKRTVRRAKRTAKRILPSPIPSTPKQGISVGGKEKLQQMFPEPSPNQSRKSMNPYGFITDTTEDFSSVPFLGSIFNIFGKTILGDQPKKGDYKNIGIGINAWINNAIAMGSLRGNLIKAFSEGGVIESDISRDISEWVERSVENLIKNKINRAIINLKRNLSLRSISGDETPLDFDNNYTDDPIEGSTPGVWGPLLDLIASKESGNNYEAMYPNTVLRGATRMTISEVARRATGAVGRYQQLPRFLVGRARAAGLNPDVDLFSPKNQDLIIVKANLANRGSNAWLRGEISDEVFMQRLSMEFAALPNASGQFYYRGQSSSLRPRQVKDALSKVKSGGNNQPTQSRDHRQRGPRGRGSTGPIVDTGIRDYQGRPIKFVSPAARQFKRMTQDASRSGINIGPAISSSLRDWGASGSRHKTGEAFDINWNTPGGVWIRNNANRYGFRYNPYSSISTHFDWVGMKNGGEIGKIKNTIKPLQTQASYDKKVIAILPIIVENSIPMPTQGRSVTFNSKSVNSSDYKSLLSVG